MYKMFRQWQLQCSCPRAFQVGLSASRYCPAFTSHIFPTSILSILCYRITTSPHVLPLSHSLSTYKHTNGTKLNIRRNSLKDQTTMHGSDCPKCGAADQSDKTCGSCGAVSSPLPLPFFSTSQLHLVHKEGTDIKQSCPN